MNAPIPAVETRYASIDGRRIAYRSQGSGSPLILINRFRGTLDTWDPLFLSSLARSHTLITFDYPGIGYSEGELPLDAAEVGKLARHLQLTRFDVLGWSYGGLIAQYVAFLHADSVGKAVLVGTNPVGRNEVPMEPIFGQHAMKPHYDLQDYTVLFFEPASEASRAAAEASMTRTWPHVDQSKVPMTMEVFQRFMAGMKGAAIDAAGLRGRYASTTVPMLVLQGDHDISFALENWYPLMRHAPTLQLVTFPACGHGPHAQHPELAARYVAAFLAP